MAPDNAREDIMDRGPRLGLGKVVGSHKEKVLGT